MKRIHNGGDVPPELHKPWNDERREAASRREQLHQEIAGAVFAALGCTTIDRRSPKRLHEAAEQIARFVEDAMRQSTPYTTKEEAETGEIARIIWIGWDDEWTDLMGEIQMAAGRLRAMGYRRTLAVSNGER